MADFNSIKKLPPAPEGSGTDIDRSEDKEFRIAGQIPCEIYNVVGGSASHTLPTGFSRVHDGYVYSVTDSALKPAATVKPSGDGSVALVEGLPASADNFMVVVYGDK